MRKNPLSIGPDATYRQTLRQRKLLLVKLLVVGAFLGVLLSASVRTTRNTPEPYASDAVMADLLASEAAVRCDVEPEFDFVTDGCSSSPDGSWVECCIEHDISYWCGGSYEERVEADAALGECVTEKGFGVLHGAITELGVKIGGHPMFPFKWRWGYGDRYNGWYR